MAKKVPSDLDSMMMAILRQVDFSWPDRPYHTVTENILITRILGRGEEGDRCYELYKNALGVLLSNEMVKIFDEREIRITQKGHDYYRQPDRQPIQGGALHQSDPDRLKQITEKFVEQLRTIPSKAISLEDRINIAREINSALGLEVAGIKAMREERIPDIGDGGMRR